MTEKRMIPRPLDTTEVGLEELRARLAKGSRTEAQQAALDRLDANDISTQVAIGVVNGLTMMAKDEKWVAEQWETGYKHLAKHGTANANAWLGARLFTGMVLMIVTIGLAYLMRSGMPR